MAKTRPCPGYCGTNIPWNLNACETCWYRLPEHLRHAVTSTHRKRRQAQRDHRAAVGVTHQWFRDNPPGVPDA